MTGFAYDLAISAVPSDAALVTELVTELAGRLRTEPVWQGHAAPNGNHVAAALVADRSRLALVLHQQLWEYDEATRTDATLLRARLRERPGSVCVMMLDDTPVPSWLAKARRYDVAALGRAGAAGFALKAIASTGGSLKGAPRAVDEAVPKPRWPEGPAPFLSQPRAHSALRRELDALIAALKSALERRRVCAPDRIFELHALPHRVIARLDEVAISFSWVAGRLATVGDGRLLVIAWSGVATETRGISALKSASPVHERIYGAEGADPEHWCWRVDDPSSRAYSTANLAAEWIARASIARGD